MSIHKNNSKVKHFVTSKWGIYSGCIILILGTHVGVYIIGAHMAYSSIRRHNPIEIEYPALVEPYRGSETLFIGEKTVSEYNNKNNKANNISEGIIHPQYVGSAQGTRYYPVDCGDASRIMESNRIYFNTENEAQNQGYTRAARCSWD